MLCCDGNGDGCGYVGGDGNTLLRLHCYGRGGNLNWGCDGDDGDMLLYCDGRGGNWGQCGCDGSDGACVL